MKTNINIQDKIDSTLNTADTIESVNISPFFKDRTLQHLFAEKEEEQTIWSWFTPKLQFATLVGIVVLNLLAYSQSNSATYEDTVNDFADTYELSPNEEPLLFN